MARALNAILILNRIRKLSADLISVLGDNKYKKMVHARIVLLLVVYFKSRPVVVQEKSWLMVNVLCAPSGRRVKVMEARVEKILVKLERGC